MALRRPPEPSARESVVPLIDVVFFLLVFFLLIGRYDATAPFEVVPARSEIGTPLPAGGRMVVVGADGRFALDGVETEPEQALARLAADAAGTKLLVKINAHAQAEVRDVLPFAARLREVGVEDVVLVVTPTPP